jgi:hypothetical protein
MQERIDHKEQPLTPARNHPPQVLFVSREETMGSALDTRQIEQVIEENIFPARADKTGTNGGLKT